MKILITGVAGFIGYHTALKYIEANNLVIGLDNLNNYYDVKLKGDRLKELGIFNHVIDSSVKYKSSKYSNFEFIKLDINDSNSLMELFKIEKFDTVIHLAAQAGVRHSILNPRAYVETNILGFFNVIDFCRLNDVTKFIYASSSSVYGISENTVLSTTDKSDSPQSLYAASKKSNELIAHSYSQIYNLKTIGLRFFTVYGPWGRPDMAPMIFTNKIINDEIIDVYNNGKMQRDFTYIQDIVESLYRLSIVDTTVNFSIFNIGNGSPVNLMDFITSLETNIGKLSKKRMMPMQIGDVVSTHANTNELSQLIKYKPQIGINEGIKKFIQWYKSYYKIN
jgi:UDP-glucuronate 4-epimerase